MPHETQAIAREPDCPRLPPAESYSQRVYSLTISGTNIPGRYGEAQLLKKESKKKKEATSQRFQTAVNLFNHHLLAKCQGSGRYLREKTHHSEAAPSE